MLLMNLSCTGQPHYKDFSGPVPSVGMRTLVPMDSSVMLTSVVYSHTNETDRIATPKHPQARAPSRAQ